MGLDTDDAIIIVDVFVRIYRAHCFVLGLDLLFTVKYNIQENRLGGGNLGDVQPPVQHWQLIASSRFISRFEVLLIFGCYFDAATYCISEVVDKKMLAKRGIARFNAGCIRDVVLVNAVGKCLAVEIDVQAACLGIKLFEAERVHDYLDLLHHFYLPIIKNDFQFPAKLLRYF